MEIKIPSLVTKQGGPSLLTVNKMGDGSMCGDKSEERWEEPEESLIIAFKKDVEVLNFIIF